MIINVSSGGGRFVHRSRHSVSLSDIPANNELESTISDQMVEHCAAMQPVNEKVHTERNEEEKASYRRESNW